MAIKKILVVDDDENIRKTLSLLLSEQYRVVQAKDGEEVMSRYARGAVDLVIADYRLPGMTGVELIAAMRRQGYRGEAILISGHPDVIDADLLSKLRISCFFAKPMDLADLNRSVHYVLHKGELMPRPAL